MAIGRPGIAMDVRRGIGEAGTHLALGKPVHRRRFDLRSDARPRERSYGHRVRSADIESAGPVPGLHALNGARGREKTTISHGGEGSPPRSLNCPEQSPDGKSWRLAAAI
ncbi:hypothetical protein GCM10027262_77480 [Nocardia tengchongensis]